MIVHVLPGDAHVEECAKRKQAGVYGFGDLQVKRILNEI